MILYSLYLSKTKLLLKYETFDFPSEALKLIKKKIPSPRMMTSMILQKRVHTLYEIYYNPHLELYNVSLLS